MNVRLIAACALAFGLVLSGRAAVAQDRDQRPGGDRDQHPGQSNEEWNRQHHDQFNDQDRQATREWYQQHQRNLGAGWRQRDRLSPAMEARLRRGERLDPRLRRQMHWLPADLSRRYGPAPRGYRYAIIGGHIVMLDSGYRVHDIFSLDFQLR